MLLARPLLLAGLAMIAFAGNSLLCRLALSHTHIDAASFTSIRLLSGALALGLIVRLRQGTLHRAGRWSAAVALFVYAACFSIAYISLPAGTGALLLFGAVQITMIGYGLWTGERLRSRQSIGLLFAFGGLTGLLLPGVAAPPLHSSILMLGAGVAWGIYSVLGRGVRQPIQATAGNFLRAVPLALILSLVLHAEGAWDSAGVVYAVGSGAIASGVGYAIWYSALPGLQSTQAATVQLCVPVLAAIGAVGVLQEPLTLRLGLAAIAVLGGIALVIWPRRAAYPSGPDHLPSVTPMPTANAAMQPHKTIVTFRFGDMKSKLIWSVWFITWLGLLAGLGTRHGYVFVVYFSAIHALLFLYLEHGHLLAFPVQVRLAYVAWVMVGTYVPHMQSLMWITTVGLAANLFVGYCPLVRLLTLLPINRNEPLSFDFVKRVFLSPPMPGRFVPAPRATPTKS